MELSEELSRSILQAAIEGKLSRIETSDTDIDISLKEIASSRRKLQKEKIISKDKQLIQMNDSVTTLDYPEHWRLVDLQSISYQITDGEHKTPSRVKENCGYYLLSARNVTNEGIKLNDVDFVDEKEFERISKRCNPKRDDILISCSGSVGRVCVVQDDNQYVMVRSAAMVRCIGVVPEYICVALRSPFVQGQIEELKKQSVQANLFQGAIASLMIPLPPIEEQKRIVNKIDEILPLLKEYREEEQNLLRLQHRFPGDLRDAILQAAMQGKLTDHLVKDTSPKEKIEEAKKSLEESLDGRRVKKKSIKLIDDEPFDLPEQWCWVRLGSVCIIARGGSPRPISNFITTEVDGINWIKIGDTKKNGKYITSTEEKIRPEGVKKSRFVHKGDFLLTNSMSFGRPYILKTEGCIHDGWLVISQPIEVFDQNYLYWLLSSSFAYNQFVGQAAGGVVKNLNSDKVANSIFPVPPIEEQRRIVKILEDVLPDCDDLADIKITV